MLKQTFKKNSIMNKSDPILGSDTTTQGFWLQTLWRQQ